MNSFNPAVAGCNSDKAHYCNTGTLQHPDTPTPRLPGIEHEREPMAYGGFEVLVDAFAPVPYSVKRSKLEQVSTRNPFTSTSRQEILASAPR